MKYLESIISIFEKHEFSKLPEVKYNRFKSSERHPISEGIIFENEDFTGEIFFYKNEKNGYCELELLIFKRENHISKFHESKSMKELEIFISNFLDDSLTVLENINQ